MNRIAPRGALIVLLLGAALAACAPGARAAGSSRKASKDAAPKDAAGSSKLKWYSFDEGSKLAAKNHKAMLVDVYTDWCGWCKRMDASTYKDSLVITELNADFVPIKLNAEHDDEELTYKGEKMTARRLAGEVFGVTGYPCTMFLKADGEVISPLPGYREAPLFTLILKFIGTGAYQKQKWPEFQKANS